MRYSAATAGTQASMLSQKIKIEKKPFLAERAEKTKPFRMSRFSLRAQANNVSGREMLFELLRDDQAFASPTAATAEEKHEC
jgi:hypothetical protein